MRAAGLRLGVQNTGKAGQTATDGRVDHGITSANKHATKQVFVHRGTEFNISRECLRQACFQLGDLCVIQFEGRFDVHID